MSKQCKTLFVRNLPFSLNKEALENYFSDFGPVKQCFIVCDKGKSRGFGYVQFTLSDDAARAKDSKLSLEGRKLLVDFADSSRLKKRERKKPGPKTEPEEEFDKEAEVEDIDETEIDVKPDIEKKVKGADLKYHKAKILHLSGLQRGCTASELDHCLQKLNVKHVAESKIIADTKAHVKFKCIRDVKKAIRRLHNQAYKDGLLQAYQLSKGPGSDGTPSEEKRSRVIVRNLSFKCQKDDLSKAFESCGPITDIKIPTNKEGKSLGFGFVQFANMDDAKKAVSKMNSEKILGRPVAVDWALPKAKYESTQNIKKETEDSESDEGSFSAESDASSDDEKKVEVDSDSESSSEDEGYKDEEEEDDSDDSDEDDDSDDEEDSEADEDDVAVKKKSYKASRKSDVDEGCTIFIRNLSFDTREDGMEEYFEQFGDIVYAKVVVNPNTEYSKGMGFVKFKSKESADKCVAQAGAGEVTLDGRQLIVSLAVSRDQANKLSQKKKEKEKKDNRNLYLAREGMIRPGTQAAEGLSKQDLDKRAKVEQLKREKLKDQNIFISPRRLCVRNIPISVDDKQLAKIFRTAAQDKSCQITECRIIRDLARANSEGIGRSQGYGFVAFQDHQHALAALRSTNNNPDIFEGNRRLIVEFSLENRKALEVQQRRKEKFMAKRADSNASGNNQAGAWTGKKGKKSGKSIGIPSLELSEQDKKIKKENPTAKGLPSHWGPKVRHKKRPSQMNVGSKKKKNRPDGKRERQSASKGNTEVLQRPQQSGKRPLEGPSEGPASKKSRRQKRKNQSDDFDKMVNSYKKKFISQTVNKKWFD